MVFPTTFTGDEPYVALLEAYPFPAFVLEACRSGAPLQPLYANPAYAHLVYGPESVRDSTPAVADSSSSLLWGLLDSSFDVEESHRLSAWFQDRATPTFVLTLRPTWLGADQPAIKLDVVKTLMDDFWVCTTVPRTPCLASPDAQVPSKDTPSPTLRKAPRDMKLPNFPPPPIFAPQSPLPVSHSLDKFQPKGPGIFMRALSSPPTSYAKRAPTATAQSAPPADVPDTSPFMPSAAFDATEFVHQSAMYTRASPSPNRAGEMESTVNSYAWENTELGPRSGWSRAFTTALNICLLSPTPCALWWGPNLVLIYNDKYAEMAGPKHPRIFGKPGKEAWVELWDQLEPLVEPIFRGESVARWDNLLFFDRLTSADLPEEVYHSWSWIPVRGDGGRVEGIINWSIETTNKVIAERRLLTLRAMGERAKLAKNVLQLTSALMTALEKNPQDVPFAAFYYCQTEHQESSGSGFSASYIRSADQPAMQLSLTLVGSIGIPDPHTATPVNRHLALDPVTHRPFPCPREVSRAGLLADPNGHNSGLPATALRWHPSAATSVRSTSPGMDTISSTRLSSLSTASAPSPNASAGGRSSTGSSHSSTTSPSFESAKESSFKSADIGPWTWPIAEAVASGNPVFMPCIPREVAETLSRRAWGDLPRQAVVVPVRAFESDGEEAALPRAVLVMGLNPRRTYDKDYSDWIDVFRTSLGVSLATALSWEAEMQRTQDLSRLDAAKTCFFSNASHELRTPLTLIMGPLDDAVTETKDPKLREKLKLAARNVSRLSRLVDSLMDFTRIEAGKSFGQFKPVQLGAFTAELASLFRNTIEKSNVEFHVQCDVMAPDPCYVDPDLWEKIVFNLIGNAFKYTMEGAISVSVVYQGKEALFIVEDTGVGIPHEDIEKVFERFHRVSTTCRSHEGTGIGLALTKELVRMHGGTLSVNSRTAEENVHRSHGSTFTVTLPVGKDHLPHNHVDDSASEVHRQQHYARGIVEEATYWSKPNDPLKTPSDSGDSGSVGSSEGSRLDYTTLFFLKKDVILLVDDNRDMRQYIKSIFSHFCSVVEAIHGQEALDMIDAGMRPDLILSDVMMPVMDGHELVKALRERPDTKLLPIILLTAKVGEESRIGGLLAGADDYVAKPFHGRELVARVHLQMQLGKRRSELETLFEERQREIKILSDHSPIGIVRTDGNGRIIYSNPRWFELTGRSGCPLDDWIESIHPQCADAVLNLWREVFEERSGGSLEFRWKNGVWTNGQVVPLGNEKSGWTGVLFTITDISDQRLYEASQLLHAQEREATARRRAEEAEERRKEADERRRSQELLIDVTSHELRQPVSAILNCSALVRENLGKLRKELEECFQERVDFSPSQDLIDAMEEDLEALDSIYQCGLAQERIANDVLSLSRIQLQVLSIHPVEFDLVPEVRQIISFFQNEVKMKRIRMSLQFGDSVQRLKIRRVRSDKSRFAQVLTNLLANAIKFTDTSTDEREIQVILNVSYNPPKDGTCNPPTDPEVLPGDEAGPIYIYVAVKDSGPGLKPDDLSLLFKRFQQGSNSHEVFGGSGLGLFVCRKICELLDGCIEVDSIYGKGATFRFFIKASNSPLEPPQEILNSSMDKEKETNIARWKNTFGGTPMNGTSKKPHILITEDNLINQTVLNRQLRGAGFATTLASNGRQAIDRILALASNGTDDKHSVPSFDAILMDCEMPVMDGLSAVREIRRLEASGRLQGRNRVYALTGNARSGQIQSAREAGMDDILIKPYKIDELLAKLHEN